MIHLLRASPANDMIMSHTHYNVVIMRAMASQINGVSIFYSAVGSGRDERVHQSSASLAFVRGIHRWPVNSPRRRPATRKMFPFDDVIMWRDFVCEESTGHWWIPPQRVGNAVLWCLPCCQFEEAAEQTIKLPVIWDALALMWCHCSVLASTVTRWSLYVRNVHTVKWIPLRPLSLSIGLGSGLSLNTRPAITWSTVRLLMTILLSL